MRRIRRKKKEKKKLTYLGYPAQKKLVYLVIPRVVPAPSPRVVRRKHRAALFLHVTTSRTSSHPALLLLGPPRTAERHATISQTAMLSYCFHSPCSCPWRRRDNARQCSRGTTWALRLEVLRCPNIEQTCLQEDDSILHVFQSNTKRNPFSSCLGTF